MIALCIAALLLVYFSNFNGALSDNISEWADFSTFISNFSIVLLTALNIWVFYKLTYHVARHEETERLFELRKALINSFTHCMYSVFTHIDEENMTCALNTTYITRAKDHFESMRRFSRAMKSFGSREYNEFIQAYEQLCKEYANGEVEGNTTIDQQAYKVLSLAREVRNNLYYELANINQNIK